MRGLGQTPLVVAIANAIAQMEGFYTPGTRPNVNNNPGDLISWGGVPTSNGFAKFPTAAAGWTALYTQVQLNINRGLNLYEFFAGKPGVYPGYASGGSAGNNPQAYANFVAQQIGADPNTPLNTLSTSAPFGAPALILPEQSNDPDLNPEVLTDISSAPAVPDVESFQITPAGAFLGLLAAGIVLFVVAEA
jgi:hypothetical protein